MDTRPVSQVKRAPGGRVLALCEPGQPWSPRPAEDAISDILGGVRYYVPWAEGDAEIKVVDHQLWCDRDPGPRNNLLDLPDCPL